MTNATHDEVWDIINKYKNPPYAGVVLLTGLAKDLKTYINKRVREARIEGAEKVMEIIPPLGRNDCEKVYEWIAQLRKEEAE